MPPLEQTCTSDQDDTCVLQVVLTQVFDTQVAHSIITQNYSQQPSLDMLLQEYTACIHPYKSTGKKSPGKWERRPLTRNQIDYAAHDVCYLHAMYDSMVQILCQPVLDGSRAKVERALEDRNMWRTSGPGRMRETGAMSASMC